VKYFLSTTLITGMLTSMAYAGPAMEEFKNLVQNQDPTMEFDWVVEGQNGDFEVYDNFKISNNSGQLHVGTFEIKENSDGSFMYRANNLEVSPKPKNNTEYFKASNLIAMMNHNEFIEGFNNMFAFESLTCENYKSPIRLQVVDYSFSGDGMLWTGDFMDMKANTQNYGNDCMVEFDYRLDNTKIQSPAANIVIEKFAGNGLSTLNGTIPSGEKLTSLDSNFNLQGLYVLPPGVNDKNQALGGVKQLTAFSTVDPSTIKSLSETKINDFLIIANSPEFAINPEDYSEEMKFLEDPKEMAKIWNGFQEMIGVTRMELDELYISPQLSSMAGPMAMGIAQHFGSDYAMLSFGMGVDKKVDGLEIDLSVNAPKVVDFNLDFDFKVDQIDSLPSNPQAALMSLPITFNGLSGTFSDLGLDELMVSQTGSGILQNLEQVLMSPMSQLGEQKSSIIIDWVKTGIDGSEAYLNIKPNFPMSLPIMFPMLMGDWDNAAQNFEIDSSSK
jgi:hypothetical protein